MYDLYSRSSVVRPRTRGSPIVMTQPTDFDETLSAVLGEAESAGSVDAAVDAWLERRAVHLAQEWRGRGLVEDYPSFGGSVLGRLRHFFLKLDDRVEVCFRDLHDWHAFVPRQIQNVKLFVSICKVSVKCSVC